MTFWKKGLFVLLTLLSYSQCSWAEFYASSVSETQYDNAPALVVRFTESIDEKADMSAFIQVAPALNNGNKWITLDGGFSWTLPFVSPNSQYRIHISSKLFSAAGNQIANRMVKQNSRTGSTQSWSVKTKPVVPSVAFSQSGHYLSGNANPALPVTVINLKDADLDIFRVNDESVDAFLAKTLYTGKVSYGNLNNLRPFMALVHSARYSFDLIPNQRSTINLDISPALNKHEHGVYVAVLRQPGVYEYRYDTQIFTRSDIGIHARFYQKEAQVQVNSIVSGRPMPDVQLSYHWVDQNNRSSHPQQNETTDSSGLSQIPVSKMPTLIVAKYRNQISFIKSGNNQLDLSSYQNVPTRHADRQAFMYGPRNLYRPGEKVSINMLLRDYDGKRVSNSPITATLYNARGSRVKNFTWRADQHGLYSYQFQLDTNAPTGNWKLVLKTGSDFQNEYLFKVEEFLPERLKLTFYDGELQKYRYFEPNTLTVPVDAQYLYGAPAAGNKVDAVLTVSPATDLFEAWKDYRFGDPTKTINQATRSIADIHLDENGQGVLNLSEATWPVDVPLKYRVTASVYEEGGRPVSRTQSVIKLGKSSDQYIGVNPQFKSRPESNQRVKFDLISVNGDGHAVPDSAKVELVRNIRDYYWYYDVNNGWSWRYDPEAYVAYSTEVAINTLGSQIELPLQWGDYELRLTSSKGQVTVYPFRTQYHWDDSGANNLRPDVISMRLDKDVYIPGEEASVTFNSTVTGQAIVQVESSDSVIFSTSIPVTLGENELPLFIDPFWNRHDLYLSIMILSPTDQISEIAPKRLLGLTHLPIKRSNAKFDVEIMAPDKVEPNRRVSAQLKVADVEHASGKKIWATMALVDIGVINITRYERPQPENYFYAPRRFESRYLDLYGKIINNLGLDNYSQRFGGGFLASEAALARGGDKAQSDVQIISFFSEPVEVVDGIANFEFDMPGFNGRVKWMAVVWSEETFGSAETETTVADKLVTQLSMPRFLAMGDKSELTLDLHNLSGSSQQFDVKMSVSNAVQSDFSSQVVTLDDKEKHSLKIPIQAIDYRGTGSIDLLVTGKDDIRVERSWNIGVRSPYPLQTYRNRRQIEAGDQWVSDIDLSQFVPGTVQAQITLSDRPALNFNEHFDYLLRYPYGCLEQTISSTYPWLLIDNDTFDALNLASTFEQRFNEPFSDAFRRKQIELGIVRLLKKQKTDGSFGYWDNTSHVSSWGSAYATELLVDARKLGVKVDNQSLSLALKFLNRQLRGSKTDNIWTEDANYYEFAYRAYSALVLSKAGNVSLGDVRRLFDQMTQSEVDRSGLPWMHLAASFQILGDLGRASEAATKALSIKRDGYGYYGDYGSSIRDIAQTLNLVMEYGFDRADLAMDLEQKMQERRWLSTQERISLARLAKSYIQGGENWQANLIAETFEQAIEQNHPFNTVITGDQFADLNSIQAIDRKLFANILWNGVPAEPPVAVNNGMTIKRNFYNLQGESIDFNQPVQSGDLFIARLDVRSLEQRYPEALVVDLLPAGFELENQNLLNASVDLDKIIIEGESVGDYFRNYRVDYQEYRDDRFVAAVSINNWESTRLFYLVRAVTPGTYAFPNSFVEDMYRPESFSLSQTPEKLVVTH